MESLKALVEDTAGQLDHELKVEVLGSYRRGAESSGDVDCLITHPRYFPDNRLRFSRIVIENVDCVNKINIAQQLKPSLDGTGIHGPLAVSTTLSSDW
jgi:tRNA nucleotidyltransferase (CCA-adding enzyme)